MLALVDSIGIFGFSASLIQGVFLVCFRYLAVNLCTLASFRIAFCSASYLLLCSEVSRAKSLHLVSTTKGLFYSMYAESSLLSRAARRSVFLSCSSHPPELICSCSCSNLKDPQVAHQ